MILLGDTNIHNEYQLKILLIYAISFLFLISIIFFLITLIKRWNKLKIARKSKHYQTEIDSILFGVLFSDENTQTPNVLILPRTDKVYTKTLIKSLISLHRSYGGKQRQLLEKFYVESGLFKYSLNKLDSGKWVNVIEGIRDLANLNYQPAFDKISSLLTHKNDRIKKEAFTAIIFLKGPNELVNLNNIDLYIDDWTQSNILYGIKVKQDNRTQEVSKVLDSKNESLALLAARILEMQQSNIDLLKIEKKIQNIKSDTIRINFEKICERIKINR